MSELKKGDKVRCYYDINTIFDGVINEVADKNCIHIAIKRVILDNDGAGVTAMDEKDVLWAHPKQCRKLVPKKKPMSVWINKDGSKNCYFKYLPFADKKWTEFIEVIKK